MPTTMGHWILPQLERLAKSQPERIEDLLEAIRERRPDLFDELHMMALEHGELSRDEAATRLRTDMAVVQTRLEVFRDANPLEKESQVIEHDDHDVARIVGKHVTVWEIVREYRRAGSVDSMRGAFPGLSEGELRAALLYAGRNPDEIGAQIKAYDEIIQRNKAAYPFAKG